MQQPLILSLDIGTSSVRAGLYHSNAKPVRGAYVRLDRSLEDTADGGSEIDADLAVSQVVSVIDALLQETENLGEISSVASCAFWHSLVGIDAKGRPTTRVLGWADTRSRQYSQVLKKNFDEAKVHNRTGAHFHSSYWPAKLSWLRRESPEAFAKTVHWLSFSDYLAFKLFARPVTSISMASGTGIFDIRKCVWDTDLLRYLKIKPESLPSIAGPSETFELTSKYAKRWPRLKQSRWFATVGDGAADSVGSGCVTRSVAALMVGTSGAMRVGYKGQPPEEIPQGLWCYRIDREHVVIGGALSDGGGLYGWLNANLKLPKNADAEMCKRGAAAHGLTFLPFLAGERSTGYHESATGAVIGLTSSHDSVDLLQAAMEAVAFRFAEIFDKLNSVCNVQQIVASGGALRNSAVWKQIIADVLGRDLRVTTTKESSSLGAVLLAIQSKGKIVGIDNISDRALSTIVHHPTCHAIYKLARKQHRVHYESILKTKL